MTECIYGLLKRRFPIIKYICTHLRNAVKITQACVVLHNIALDLIDHAPDQDHPNYQEVEVPEHHDDDEVPADQIHIVNQLNSRQRREMGMQARDHWRRSMDCRPYQVELTKMANHRVESEVHRRARR